MCSKFDRINQMGFSESKRFVFVCFIFHVRKPKCLRVFNPDSHRYCSCRTEILEEKILLVLQALVSPRAPSSVLDLSVFLTQSYFLSLRLRIKLLSSIIIISFHAKNKKEVKVRGYQGLNKNITFESFVIVKYSVY